MPKSTGTQLSQKQKEFADHQDELGGYLSEAGVSEAAYEAFKKSIAAINDKTAEINRTDSRNIQKPLTGKNLSELLALYRDALDNMRSIKQEMKQEKEDDGTVPDKAAVNLLKIMESSLLSDYAALSKVNPDAEKLPLSVYLNFSRVQTVNDEIGGSMTLGGALSSRKLIKIRDEAGNVRLGLFTVKKNDGDVRVDSRNSAMSTVAALLGVPKVLAKSEPMNAKFEGETVSGTFMEAIQGTEMGNADCKDSPLKMVPDSPDAMSPGAKKDLMDIDILDYICQNTDRHLGNVICQFGSNSEVQKAGYNSGLNVKKNVRLEHVVGIDNDCSFAGLAPEEQLNRLGGPEDLLYCSEGMAKALKILNRETLAMALSGYGIGEAGIKAACDRLEYLQKMLDAGQKLSDKLEGYPENGLNPESLQEVLQNPGNLNLTKIFGTHKKNGADVLNHALVVIPDRLLPELDLRGMRAYKTTNTVTDRIVRNMAYADKENKPFFEEEVSTPLGRLPEKHKKVKSFRVEENDIFQTNKNNLLLNASNTLSKDELVNKCLIESRDFVGEAARKTKTLRSSKAFDNIRDTLDNIRMLTEKMGRMDEQGGFVCAPTDLQLTLLVEYYDILEEQCNTYLDGKKKQKERGKKFKKYTTDRIEFIEKVLASVKGRSKMLDEAYTVEDIKEGMRLGKIADEIGRFDKAMNACYGEEKYNEAGELFKKFCEKNKDVREMQDVIRVHREILNKKKPDDRQSLSNDGWEDVL